MFKFLVYLDNQAGELDSSSVAKLNNIYNQLWKIEAKTITTARKIALAKLERLAKRTKLPWTLIEETGRIVGKADGRSDNTTC